MEPRYAYFTVTTNDCGEIGFVCVRLERPKGSSHCKASFSFCAPNDASKYWDKNSQCWKFSLYKPLARKIADSRFTTRRVNATIEFECDGQIGNAFRKALDLAKTTTRSYSKHGKRCPTVAPEWFVRSTIIDFGLNQPEK